MKTQSSKRMRNSDDHHITSFAASPRPLPVSSSDVRWQHDTVYSCRARSTYSNGGLHVLYTDCHPCVSMFQICMGGSCVRRSEGAREKGSPERGQAKSYKR